MADSFIQVPPDSTGKQLDTRTAPDGNHREVVAVGSPTLADVAEADVTNGLDVDVTRVQGTVAVSNAGLTALAGAISGTEIQVDIVSGGGSGTQYTEDAAAPADPVGTALAMVRDDVLSALTSADGDIVAARGTDKGELYVKHVDAIPVTDNGGVLTVDGTVIVGSSALPTGAATAALQLPNSHDVTVDNAAGAAAVNIQDGGNVITVDGTVALSGVVDTELPAAAALADNTANPTVPGVGAFLMGYDGTNWDRLQTGAATGGALKVDGSAVTQPVSAVSLPLPTGAATLAEQQTQSTDLDAIRVATETLDNAISGSEMQVDVVAALPAGTNNIGDVDVLTLPSIPAGTNNIGDVDVLSVVPGTGATSLGKAIDSVPGATDTGVAALVVRDDALATLTPVDGDYTVLRTDSTGALWTRSTSAAGGTSATDEAAFVAGTSTGTPLMGARDDTAPDTLAEDTIGIIRATTNRALHVNLRDAAGAELAVGGGTQYDEDTPSTAADKLNMAGVVRKDTAATLVDTDGDRTQLQVDATGRLHVNGSGVTQPVSAVTLPLPTGAATLAEQQSQTTHLATIAGDTTAIETAVQIMDDWDESDRAKVNPIAGQAGVQGASGVVTALTQRVVLATDVALPAGANNIGDVDVLTLPALVAGTANIGDVDVLTLPALVAGTANIGDVDIASVAAGTVMEVVGDVAADAAVPANPVIIGARASTAQPTPVSADGDSVNIWANRKGAPIVSAAPHVALIGDPWALTGETAQYTTTQTSAVLVAGGASERLVVTKVQIQVGGTTAGTLQLYFGTGAYSRGTTLAIFDGEFAPSATLKPGVVMDGPFISAANGDDLLVTTSAAINPLTITVWYYVLT